MATLLNAVTENTTGTATSFTAPCTVYVDGDLGGVGGTVRILQSATEGGTYKEVAVVRINSRKRFNVEANGTYWLKAQFIEGASGSSGITVTANVPA